MPTSTPIFILGKQRSGTTWLANQLCAHSKIVGVQHERHSGIHESAYFSHVYGRYGDLSVRTNFVEFVEAMAVSDTVRILGFQKDFLYSLWPTVYEDFFTAIMEAHAERNEAKFWLEKSPEHTLLAHELQKLYPGAKFIAVIRDVHDVLESALARYPVESLGFRKVRLSRVALNWLRYKRSVEQFAHNNPAVLVLHYADLKSDTEGAMRCACRFLGLEFESGMLLQKYRANTTFVQGRKRGQLIRDSERSFVNGVVALAEYIPRNLFSIFGRNCLKIEQRDTLPKWFYSMYFQNTEGQKEASLE